MRHYEIGGCLDQQHSTNREWREAGGGIQSLVFYDHVLRNIGLDHSGNLYVDDYGCGMGDGIALIQAAWPESQCYGFDVDEDRIAAARERWPTIPFEVGDLTTTEREADIIMCIHTLEHVPNVLSAVKRLRSLCQYLVVVYPIIKNNGRGGHSEKAITDAEFGAGVMLYAQHQAHYETARRYSHTEPLMVEGNNLYVLKGER